METMIFSRFIDEQSSKEQHLFKAEIFCNITNVFTVTFDEVNAPLLNSFIKKKKKKSTDLVYVSIIYCTSSHFNLHPLTSPYLTHFTST